MAEVLPFPLPQDHARTLIREAAEAGRVLWLSPPEGGEWYVIVTRRQVDLCLREGNLVSGPDIDAQGNVTCVLERFGAGVTVRVRAVLKKAKNNTYEVIVIGVENRL